MPAESASAAASTGINAPGGSITKNSPGVVLLVIGGIVALFFIFKRRQKNG